MAGDINCNLAIDSEDSMAAPLEFLYEAYQFPQLIKEYTSVTRFSKTLINHFITNEPRGII